MTYRDQHVVVVGGGFAGLHAASGLAKMGFRVTLIDRHPYTTFQPLLYQVATGGLNPGDITYALRRFASNHRFGRVRFRRATVTGIDQAAQQVIVSRGEPIGYDHLVLAQGVGANFFGTPGSEYARSIYTRRSALDVRDIIFSGLETLTASGDPDRRFTVAIVGGGPTGVEMAGALAEMKSDALAVVYPEISPDNFRVVLVEMGPALLAPFEPKLRDYTLEELKKRGVDVRLNTAIAAVHPDRVDFKEGGSLEVDVVVWAAGVGAHEVVKQWQVPQGRGGRIEIDPTLTVKGTENIYAVGDAAICDENPLPQLAQPAMQMGHHVASVIKARVDGTEPEPFHYRDLGTMATIGRNAAVLQLPDHKDGRPGWGIDGLIAWLVWVVVHLRSLLGGRNRLQAMINMGVRYLTWPKSATGILGDITDSPAELGRKGEDSEAAEDAAERADLN